MAYGVWRGAAAAAGGGLFKALFGRPPATSHSTFVANTSFSDLSFVGGEEEAHDVWHAPVNRFEDMLDDGQANDVGAFVEVPGVSHKLIALCVPPHIIERHHQTTIAWLDPDAARLLTLASVGVAQPGRCS